jgi:phospholipid/cholesterol/gamma-HCH transport system substrate-binding protein
VKHAIRKHLRDFVAIIVLFVIAMTVAVYIAGNQRLYLPGWVPGVGTDFYEIEAEFPTAQAVVPGQGQTVDIAGVPVGEIGTVDLRNGVAVVKMKIRKKYAPVYRDASLLLRPKTGLKDMIVEMDPGNKQAGAVNEGETIPVSQTSPDVNLDEVLSSLDADTRSYLTVLITAGGEAFKQPGYSSDLRETFKRFEPTSRDIEKITKELAKRRRNTRRVIHNFRLLTEALGDKDTQLAQFVDSSNENFAAFAAQDNNLRAALRELPPTLQQAETTLGKTTTLADELGPTMESLRPTARQLGPTLRQVRPFLRETTPIIRNQLRPFAREARPAVRELRTTASRLKPITPRLTRTFEVVNSLLNSFAYNPAGAEEGYLFWASWLNHTAASIFSPQDAHGPIRRGTVISSCDSLRLLESVVSTNPQLDVLYQLLGAPPSNSPVCPSVVGPGVPEQGTPGTPSRELKKPSDLAGDKGGPDNGRPVTSNGGKPLADGDEAK